MRFEILANEPVRLRASEPLASFYQLSPYVWRHAEDCHVLIRAVNHSENPAEKVARVYHGTSDDGLVFQMDDAPAIAPGPQTQDVDGCEDPSVALVDDTMYVYYTGWNQTARRGSLMLAQGSDARHLRKRGVALASTPQHVNPKEAETARAGDGSWRLFFEFASEDASKIGIARSNGVAGPWRVQGSPFERRGNSWDAWHLSTGPIVIVDGAPVMFYNGATQDARWRIGWVRFDTGYERVLDRCDDPLIVPPKPKSDETDIAFASSAVTEGDLIRIYFSVADQYMRRITLQSRGGVINERARAITG